MADVQIFGDHDGDKRPLWRSMWRGWRGKCPSCGHGLLFAKFLKTVEDCPSCAEHIAHHRAHDLPPYLNIFIVGHVIVGLALLVMRMTDWSAWTHLAIWTPVTIALTLVLMQPLKGMVVGLQWANRMHGFGGDDDFDRDVTAPKLSDHG
ncbi:MAG: DUF983 domain-containing protein [Pseudomonadota bacterium]